MLQDCSRYHEGEAGRGGAAAKRATADTRSRARQDAPVHQHTTDFKGDARILVRSNSWSSYGVDGVRCGLPADARSRQHVAQAPRVDEFSPSLCAVLGTGGGWV